MRPVESFFDVENVVEALGCTESPGDIVEFACGFGTFTLPVARRTSGTVHALDIDPEMIALVTATGLTNVLLVKRDFISNGTGLPDKSTIHAMVFNILHVENPVRILREVWRILLLGGNISIIHWRTDIKAPCGPSVDIRPSPQQCLGWAVEAGIADGRAVMTSKKVPHGTSRNPDPDYWRSISPTNDKRPAGVHPSVGRIFDQRIIAARS